MNQSIASNDYGGKSSIGISREEVDVRDIVLSISNGKWVIIVCALLFSALGVAYTYVAEPKYSGDALVQIEEQQSAVPGIAELAGSLPSDSAVGAEIAIIRSRSVLGEVVDKLGLDRRVEISLFPVLGRFFYKESCGEGSSGRGGPGILQEYVWCGGLEVGVLRSIPGNNPVELNVIRSSDVEFSIANGKGDYVASGRIGEIVNYTDIETGERVSVSIRSISASVGGVFKVVFLPRVLAIKQLSSSLQVSEVGRDTGVMKLQMEGGQPDEIVEVLDAVAREYLKQNVERKSAEAQQSLTFLNEQLPEVRSQLAVAENKLASFREQNQTIDLSIETESVLTKMVDLEQRISELDLKRSELRRIYTEDHPLLKTLAEQRAQLVTERASVEAQTSTLPDVQQELLRLVREVEVTTELYTFMLNKAQELRVVEAGTVGNVRVIDGAAVSYDPVWPKPKRILTVSFLLGVMFGVCLVVYRRLVRVGLTDPDGLESAVGVPVYAVLPLGDSRERQGGSNRLTTLHFPNSIVTEAFKSLRTSLYFGTIASDKGRVISVSGPTPNVGKTFVSTNLAQIISSSGKKVLFVDADMRRGDADKAFGLPRSPGLSNVLSGTDTMDWRKCLNKIKGSDGLDVLLRGKSPPNPAELLLTGAYRELIEIWRDEYDFVIVDTPPVLAVTDPVILGAGSDQLFLIGRAGVSSIHELQESINRFQRGGVEVTGVIVNGMTQSLSGKAKYGYGYYSYSYSPNED